LMGEGSREREERHAGFLNALGDTRRRDDLDLGADSHGQPPIAHTSRMASAIGEPRRRLEKRLTPARYYFLLRRAADAWPVCPVIAPPANFGRPNTVCFPCEAAPSSRPARYALVRRPAQAGRITLPLVGNDHLCRRMATWRTVITDPLSVTFILSHALAAAMRQSVSRRRGCRLPEPISDTVAGSRRSRTVDIATTSFAQGTVLHPLDGASIRVPIPTRQPA